MFNPANVAVGGPATATLENSTLAVLSPPNSYTPTISNFGSATTAPTTTGRYWISGNICHVFIQSKLGTGTITVGDIRATLPVPMDITGMLTLSTILKSQSGMNDVSLTAPYAGVVRMVDANNVQILRYTTTGGGNMGAVAVTLPFTWATLDELSIDFDYPIA